MPRLDQDEDLQLAIALSKSLMVRLEPPLRIAAERAVRLAAEHRVVARRLLLEGQAHRA